MATEFGPALGVSTADFNGDGWIDIYVANDGQPNQLWINQRNGTFRNTALLSGAAVGEQGKAKRAWASTPAISTTTATKICRHHADRAGQQSVTSTTAPAFRGAERAARASARPACRCTGFGAGWLDFDNDGWLDLLSVNGAVSRDPQRPKEPFSLQQRKQLLRNLGNGRFEDVTGRAGAAFQLPEVGRGAAFGDIDNDGDIDVSSPTTRDRCACSSTTSATASTGSACGSSGHAAGATCSARARRIVAKPMARALAPGASDGSYASANDPRVLVGPGRLGDGPPSTSGGRTAGPRRSRVRSIGTRR